MISVRCGQCEARLALDESLAGRKARCPRCRRVFIVPEPIREDAESFPAWLLLLCCGALAVLCYIGLTIAIGATAATIATLVVGGISVAVLLRQRIRVVAQSITAWMQSRAASPAEREQPCTGPAKPGPTSVGTPSTSDDAEDERSLAMICDSIAVDAIPTDPVLFADSTTNVKAPVYRNPPSRPTLPEIEVVYAPARPTPIPPPPPSTPPRRATISAITRWVSGSSAEDVRFYGRGSTLRLNGVTVESPLVYSVDGRLSSPYDASLIELDLEVSRQRGRFVDRLPYWPSYRGCSPQQRRNYVDWLTNGRSDPTVELGYVFIYFYGLERRVLMDRVDHDAVLHEVLRLLAIYRSSNSFRRYAVQLLWMMLLSAPDGFVTKPVLAMVVDATDSWTDELLTAWMSFYVGRGEPLPAKVAMLVAHHDPRSPRSVVVERQREKFSDLFEQRYRARFDEGLILRSAKHDARFEYRPASETLLHLWYDHPLRSIALPNVLGLHSQFKPLVEVWTSVVEDLRSFDRAQQKSVDAELTAEMYEALPPELRRDDHPHFQQWCGILDRCTGSDGWSLVPVSELAGVRGVAKRTRLTKKQCEEVLRSADAMGFCVEPDARETGLAYRWEELVSVFPSDEDGRGSLKSYHAASILLRLGLSIAAADGAVEAQELAAVTRHLEQQFDLSGQDATRLEHLAYVLFRSECDTKTVTKPIAEFPPGQKRIIGDFLVAVAAADNVITRDEVRALRKLYRQMGLATDALDALSVGQVRVAEVESESKQEGDLVLDHDRIRAIMSETERVVELLQSVMLDDDAAVAGAAAPIMPQADSQPVRSSIGVPDPEFDRRSGYQDTQSQSTAPSDSTSPYEGLDQRYHAFLDFLLAKPEWSRDAILAAARDHRLMLGGAVEIINAWALDQYGDCLIDDTETCVTIRADLLAQSR